MDIGLVLQGGGALGAYEWGAVNVLAEAGYNPVAITGVSIGSLNSAAVAGARDGDIAASLDALWDAITLIDWPFMPKAAQARMSLFGNRNFFRMRLNPWLMPMWPSLYSTQPMLRTLNRLIDFDRVNDTGLHKVAVTATNVHNGAPARFSNTDATLDARHFMASGSLPPGFPMTDIDGVGYIDGGMFSNTPLGPLFQMLDDDQLDNLPIFVIDLFPETDADPSTITDMISRMSEIAFENRITAAYGGDAEMRAHGRMVKDLAARLRKEDPAVLNDPTMAAFLRQRAMANVTVIRAPHVPLGGESDFSRDGVAARKQRGAIATQACLEAEKPAAARKPRRKNARAG